MKDFLATSRGTSPIMERASLSLSAVKSLVLREKDDKFAGEFGADDKVLSLINLLLDAGRCQFLQLCVGICFCINYNSNFYL